MELSIRTRPGQGFWRNVQNDSEETCDYCGEKLWANPGGKLYCNNWEADHDEPARYQKISNERRHNTTVTISRDNTTGEFITEWIQASSSPTANDGGVGETIHRTLVEAEAAKAQEFESRGV